jgi:trimeric autotransporter adhesin
MPWKVRIADYQMTFGATRKILVSRVAFFMIAAIAVLVSSFATFAQSNSIEAPMNACSDNWDPRFLIGGPNQGSSVSSVIRDSQGTIFIAGSFNSIDGVSIARVARWNGSRWIQVGNGLNGNVQTIAFAPDGTLYAGGGFTASGNGTVLNRIARLEKSEWVPVGEGFNSLVNSITFDPKGQLLVGGAFTLSGASTSLNYVARWDGKQWQDLGTGPTGIVLSLLWTPQGLVAGGIFTGTTDGRAVNRIAVWDGFYWKPLGGGLNNTVRSIIWDKNSVLAVGDFTQSLSPSTAINRVARFDGEKWAQVGDGLNSSVLAAHRDQFDVLWVAGSFTSSGNETGFGSIARLSGKTWRKAASGVSPGLSVSGISSLPNGDVVFVGAFTSAGGDSRINRIARWNGAGFETMTAEGLAPNGTVNALVEDLSGNIYIGGNFLTVGGISASRIAKWDGQEWSALSSGMNGTVSSLAIDSQGRLYAGGNFTSAGGLTVNRIARWTGTTWEPIGSGFNGSVQTMVFGPNGNLYVGGNFTSSGTVTGLNRIARWDGEEWHAVGAGFSSTVNAIAFSPTTGTMFAGGSFIVTGDRLAAYIARFDPIDGWFGLGDGMSNPVRALAFDNKGRLFVAGDFTIADKIPANRVAIFQNNIFSPVGAGVNGSVSAMRLGLNGEIHIAGNFTASNQNTVRRFARWNGSQWTELGNGINEQVLTMLRSSSGDFYLGGFFSQTGCKNSSFLARYIPEGFIATNSTDWHTAGNWSSNLIPTESSNLAITQSLTISSADAVVGSLYVAEGISIDIAKGLTLTISEQLILHGGITGEGEVVIDNCSPNSISRADFTTGHISANLKRCVAPNNEYLFPLGDLESYSPVAVSNPDSIGTVTLTTRSQIQPDAENLPEKRFTRHWIASSTGISIGDIKLSYPSTSVNGVSLAEARLFRTIEGSVVTLPSYIKPTSDFGAAFQIPIDGIWTIAESTSSCVPIIGNLPNRPLMAKGESVSITVTVPSDCAWKGFSRSSWIILSPTTAVQGSGQLTITVEPNGFGFRQGTVSLGLIDLAITQTSEGNVSGRIVTLVEGTEFPIENVTISGLGAYPNNTLSDSDGNYVLEDLGDGSYTIVASKVGEPNGISSADASLVLMYVMGLVDLSPAQQLVADVSGDGTISAFDASRIARYVVGLPNSGATGTWRFLPSSYFANSVQGTIPGKDFIGVLMGDVTGNWRPSKDLEKQPSDRIADAVSIRSLFGGSPAFLRKTDLFPKVPTTGIRIGESLQLPITVGDLTSAEAFSFEIELEYDPSSFAVDPRNLIETAETLSVNHRLAVNTSESGVIRIAGFGTTPFSGGGALFKLNLQTLESKGVTTPLRVVSFQLNETPVKPFLLTR